MKAIPTSEADFQTQIIALAHLQGGIVHHTRSAMNRRGQWSTPIQGDKGFPDLVLARGGRIIFAELKSEKGKPTPEQQAWLEALNWGAEAYVWRPDDWPDIERTLRRDA